MFVHVHRRRRSLFPFSVLVLKPLSSFPPSKRKKKKSLNEVYNFIYIKKEEEKKRSKYGGLILFLLARRSVMKAGWNFKGLFF